jgi:hypothetical protein
MSVATLEQRLEALEKRVTDSLDVIHNISFPELDKEIDVIRKYGHDVAATASKSYDDALTALDKASMSIKNFTADVRNTEISLGHTISGLLTRNGSKALIDALVTALKSTILIVRPASRAESLSPDVLVTRAATAAELKLDKK